MDSIIEIQEKIENVTNQLWQGKGADIELISACIDTLVNEITDHIGEMKAVGIDFPMEYVTAASKNLIEAISKKDDYLLADNLYYEWKEIIIVYEEVINEMKGMP
ncbi:MAG: hypothetical protein K6F30_02520 [Lachnospiraceae bacterium]|nr:hypothetical protein [Lachnospiraceae bacterium]